MESNNLYQSNNENAYQAQRQYKSIQSWKIPKTQQMAEKPNVSDAKQDVINSLEKAAIGKIGTFDVELKNALAYSNAQAPIDHNPTQKSKSTESFQFNDVIDVVNPLQHLPIVGMAYRGITGDELHPVSQIIGGAIYGGPVGAVTGTANAISKVQTGKDLGEHALEMAGIRSSKTVPTPVAQKSSKEIIIEKFDTQHNANILPKTAKAFANMAEPIRAYEYIEVAEGRTAGKMPSKRNWAVSIQETTQPQNLEPINIAALAPREELTSLSLSPMPPKRDT